MGEKRTDLLRGTLDLLVLKALSVEPLHGVGISRRIRQITKGSLSSEFRFAISLSTPHGGKGVGGSRVAHIRKQSPGQILPPDFLGSRPAQSRGTGLE